MEYKPVLSGSFVTNNLQYNDAQYESLKELQQTTETLSVWRRDKVTTQFVLISFDDNVENISIELSGLRHNGGVEVLEGAIKEIRSVKAHAGMRKNDIYEQNLPDDSRAAANELLDELDVFSLPPHSIRNLWLEFEIPVSAVSGCYTGEVSVSSSQLAEPLRFEIKLEVIDLILPEFDKDSFTVEYWQNPYAVAEYYNVDVFSKEHFEILEPHLKLYQSSGGNTVTATLAEEVWDGQTYSKHKIKFPSMVKWWMLEDGSFEYDYSDFDQWVRYTSSLGLGDKIICYSILPWNQQIIYENKATGITSSIEFKIGDEAYFTIWDHFLRNFMRHTEALKIKDRIYLGIDERGFDADILTFTRRITGSDGQPFKMAGAIDHLKQHESVVLELDFLSVGSMAIKQDPEIFEKVRKERDTMNKETFLYSCTGHAPGNFSLSAPGESYWTILFAYAKGTTGFLRWAYDSWVENPLEDVSHTAFEAGDCFLVFPNEREAVQPQPKSSTRFEKLAEGVRDVNKLLYLKKNYPEIEDELEALLLKVEPTYPTSGYYLTEASKKQLAEAMSEFKHGLHQLAVTAHRLK